MSLWFVVKVLGIGTWTLFSRCWGEGMGFIGLVISRMSFLYWTFEVKTLIQFNLGLGTFAKQIIDKKKGKKKREGQIIIRDDQLDGDTGIQILRSAIINRVFIISSNCGDPDKRSLTLLIDLIFWYLRICLKYIIILLSTESSHQGNIFSYVEDLNKRIFHESDQIGCRPCTPGTSLSRLS